MMNCSLLSPVLFVDIAHMFNAAAMAYAPTM